MVELIPDSFGYEINLDDEIPFEIAATTVPKFEDLEPRSGTKRQVYSLTEKPKKKSKKERNELVGESAPETANVDGWFVRQFTKFFDDKEIPNSDGKTDM
jgi:hypothetical protein